MTITTPPTKNTTGANTVVYLSISDIVKVNWKILLQVF